MSQQQWYRDDASTIYKKLNSQATGLSSKEALIRLHQHGPNKLSETPATSHLKILLEQFINPLVYILFIVAIISISLREYLDASIVIFVVALNSFIGYYQEVQSQNALEKLKSFLMPKCKVIRDGEPNEIDITDIVPGDIILVEPGSKIPADMRIVENIDLRVNEATLTGEAIPIAKNTDAIKYDVTLGDRHNMLYSGTYITSGRGTGIVVDTGSDTEFGKIASTIEEAAPPPSPLEIQLKTLSKQIVVIVIVSMLILVTIGLARRLDALTIFFTAINLAVSAIPEGLPTVLTITLALGVRRMAKKQAIIRHLASVETLGAVTLVATDKTGTLTRDEMIVEKIYIDPSYIDITGEGYIPTGKFLQDDKEMDPQKNHQLHHFLTTGALCNSSSLVKEGDDWKIIGDPTEASLLVAAAKAGFSPVELEKRFKKYDEIPFHTAKRYMATLHYDNLDGHVISIKGATEKILPFCSSYFQNNRRHTLTKADTQRFQQINNLLASEGYRVLMLAFKEDHKHSKITEKDLSGATLLGLCALKDSPRPEANPAIASAHRAGIRVVMITGDHALTAQNIATNVGIVSEINSANPYTTVTDEQLETLSPSQMKQTLKHCNIYARISPINKFNLVKKFQKMGYLVVVTGDGINDAPALKQADVGVAMGKTGTDVSREASDMILANDNFATIIKAIEEGRAIYQNIKRVILYLLSTNIGEIMVIATTLILGATLIPNLPLPLEAVQILWINLITDGAGTIPLAMEPKHSNIMSYPPRNIRDKIIDRTMLWRIIIVGITMTIGTVFLYVWEYNHTSYIEARTVAFEAMVLFQILNMFNCRSLKESIIKLPLFQNIYILGSFVFSFGLTIAAVYLPPLQKIFYTTSLDGWQWLRIISVSFTVIIVVEVEKYIRRHYLFENPKIQKQTKTS